MAFTNVDSEELALIKGHKNDKGYPRGDKWTFTHTDPLCPSSFMRFCVSDKKSLGNPTCQDTLNSLSITDMVEHSLTYSSAKTGESFSVSAYLCDVCYDITIAKYTRFVGFTKQTTHVSNYNHSGKATKQLGFCVADILKYYYHQNKDTKYYGFKTSDVSEDEEDTPINIKNMWNIVKDAVSHSTSPNTIPFGIGESALSSIMRTTAIRMWNIKNNTVKWDKENFFNQIVFMSISQLEHPQTAQNLIYLYLYGDNYYHEDVNVIKFDEPKSIVDVIDTYENKSDGDVLFIRNKICKKLKKKEKEQLEKYPEFVLPKQFFSQMNKSHWRDCVISTDKVGSKVMSYPLFAFRNLYIHEWIPKHSIELLNIIIYDKLEEEKDTVLKYLKEKSGGYIDPHSNAKYDHLEPKRDYGYSRQWERCFNERMTNKVERRDREDMKSEIRHTKSF